MLTWDQSLRIQDSGFGMVCGDNVELRIECTGLLAQLPLIPLVALVDVAVLLEASRAKQGCKQGGTEPMMP